MNRLAAALLPAVISFAALAQAPATPPVRLRGTLEKLEGQTLTVKTREGETKVVKLADNFKIVGITKASIADVTKGKFIGSTTVGEKDGNLVAEEVHIFPEEMRGTGEGHYDWDLRPASKMSNGNVAEIVKGGDGSVMTVQYKGGEKKIAITGKTTVVSYGPADKAELKPGAHIFVVAQKQPDGTLTAARVNVGLNGQKPPM
ncbi:MAG TPA: hypothetical protein VH083_07705 [Myxococcales bacterium]|jgi:hypothetical protein|nr:hypothetical protein [Myxococcales bacterium]